MRKNGLNFPLSLKQILSYVGFLTYGLSYNLLIITKTPVKDQPIRYPIFNIMLALGFFMHLLTSYIDPGDPLISLKDQQSEDSAYLRCSLCNSSIHLYSQHCITCNKCIYRYDHHCAWVNNCIGFKNYKPFLILIATITGISSMATSSSITALLGVFYDENNHDSDHELVSTSFILFLCGFSISGIFYFGYICFFHLYLISKGLTTYEYIRIRRSRRFSNKINPRAVEKDQNFSISMQTELAPSSIIN